MSAITQAFFDRLTGDTALTGQLGTYNGGPSVFTKIPLPADFDIAANGPYILTTGESSQTPGEIDTKNSAGRVIDRDVRCFADLALSPSTIEDIAERVRDLFHRQAINMTGFTTTIAEATGPIEADEDDALGRIVTVSLTLAET